MQTVKLRFTKIVVPDFERKGLIAVRFYYRFSGKEDFIEKRYNYIVEDPAMFAGNLMAEVKSICRKKTEPDCIDDSVLGSYVNVQVDELRSGLTEEKLANMMKQLGDRIRDIKGMSSSNNYIARYLDVKGIVMHI